MLERASVDLVFSSLTLHYVVDLDRLLSVVARALTPGGSLVVSVEAARSIAHDTVA